jgi:ATP-dependent Clp protease ATP-binding subunit ClpB
MATICPISSDCFKNNGVSTSSVERKKVHSEKCVTTLFGAHVPRTDGKNVSKRFVIEQVRAFDRFSKIDKKRLNESIFGHQNEIIQLIVDTARLDSKEKKSVIQALKRIFKNLEEENFRNLLEGFFSEKFIDQIPIFLKTVESSVEFKDLETLIRKSHPGFTTAKDKASNIKKFFPADACIEDKKFGKEVRNTASVVANFFPHLIDTFLAAFNLLNVGKGPETIWDFAAMLEIYYKVFLVPHTLMNILSAVLIPTWQAFLIVLAVVAVLIILLYCYLKWLRPCPNKIPNCVNLTEEKRLGRLESVVGREKQINQVVGCLQNQVNILLVGEPGVGKSDIMMGALKAYKGKKKIFSPDPTCLGSSFSSPTERLNRILNFVRGYENQVAFFIDELGEAIKKPDTDLKGFLKLFLGKRGGIQVIAAMTQEEYNKYIVVDKSLDERFIKINVPPAPKNLTKLILDDRLHMAPNEVDIEPHIIDYIIECTDERMPENCQPRKSVQVLEQAINRVHSFKIETYITTELRKKQEELESLQRSYSQENSTYMQLEGEEGKNNLFKLNALREEIEVLQKRVDEQKKIVLKLKDLLKQKKETKKKIQKNVIQITTNQKSSAEEKNLLLDLFYILPAVEKAIKECLKTNIEIPVTINKQLIDLIISGMNENEAEE